MADRVLLRKASSGKLLALFASLAVPCFGSPRYEVAKAARFTLLPAKFKLQFKFENSLSRL